MSYLLTDDLAKNQNNSRVLIFVAIKNIKEMLYTLKYFAVVKLLQFMNLVR